MARKDTGYTLAELNERYKDYNIPQKLNKRLQKDHDESIIIKEKSRQRKRIIREFEKPP